jgi:Protein of unknown function (DUF3761)/Protein of unknown function (DUF1524)
VAGPDGQRGGRRRVAAHRSIPVVLAAITLLTAACSVGKAEAPAATASPGSQIGGPAASPSPAPSPAPSPGTSAAGPHTALALLARLTVKGRAPMTGYERAAFGAAWTDTNRNGCDTRNDVLRRDLTNRQVKTGTDNCVALAGWLAPDPYTGTRIHFVYGGASEVDIDHVVALGDAWQTGAFRWVPRKRLALANDPMNLLAVSASANRSKGDGDAATWLPSNTTYRCAYVARQVAVKAKYGLWVTSAERAATARILDRCPALLAPTGTAPTISPVAGSTYTPTSSRPTKSAAANPAYGDASAVCNDGTLSYSAHRRGTCSRHQGVRQWLKNLPG